MSYGGDKKNIWRVRFHRRSGGTVTIAPLACKWPSQAEEMALAELKKRNYDTPKFLSGIFMITTHLIED
jgi:hypothetical protein